MPQACKPFENLMDDGRRRLHPDQYEAVRAFYAQCKSQRVTAKRFGVSRRLITFILYPERLRALQEAQRKAHHWRTYRQPKEKWRETMAKHRAKKREFGLLFNPNKKSV